MPTRTVRSLVVMSVAFVGLVALDATIVSPQHAQALTSAQHVEAQAGIRPATKTTPSTISGPFKQVTAGGVTVNVPSAWPVIDYRLGGPGCVRLDRHAVYLGEPTVSDCPAHLVGSVEAVRFVAKTPPVRGASKANAHGLAYYGDGSIDGNFTFPSTAHRAGVVVTTGSDPILARVITASVSQSASRTYGPGAWPSPAQTVSNGPTTPSRQAQARAASTSLAMGFDACSAPSVTTMQAWKSNSSYVAANIYMGGADRACTQQYLNAGWVTSVVGQGWTLIPTYVGLQAPCNGYAGSIDPAHAARQGAASADDAVNGMTALAIGSGNPVYFDMENYDIGNQGCVQAVETFLDAWTVELHNRGYLSGVYSSAGSGITNLVQETSNPSFHLPDAIWFARWSSPPNPAVYGDPAIPDGDWNSHQRIHQYQGGHDETHGGVTINIDSDSVDGPTAPNGQGSFPSVDLFHPLPTARIYGTDAPALTAGSDRVIAVLGAGGIPASNVDAVVINVEVYNPTTAGYVRVTPTGSPSQTAVQEFGAGQTISNLVTVMLGPGGTISLHLSAGSAHLYVDVSGYFSPSSVSNGALFHPVPTSRIYGTNSALLYSQSDIDINVLGVGGIPATNVDAVVLNVEVFNPTSAGYLRVTPTGSPSQTAVQEFGPGQAISNLVTVMVGPAGTISLHLSAGMAYVFVDVSGYYSSPSVTTGDMFHPLPTARIYGTNAPALVRGSDRDISVLGVGGIPATNVDAVVLNVEVYNPSTAGYLRITPTSNSSGTAVQEFGPGQTISNLVAVKVSPGGTVTAHLSTGSAQIYFDTAGYFA